MEKVIQGSVEIWCPMTDEDPKVVIFWLNDDTRTYIYHDADGIIPEARKGDRVKVTLDIPQDDAIITICDTVKVID